MVKYCYDAWGNCETVVLDASYNTLSELNPFRYRSYYFDTETNLYYLQTRYYDPETGRFLSRDSIEYLVPTSIGGTDSCAYCGNNPVMRKQIVWHSSRSGNVFGARQQSSFIFSTGQAVERFDLGIVSDLFGFFEDLFSIIKGGINASHRPKNLGEVLDHFDIKDEISDWFMVVGITLNVGLSIYENLTAPDLLPNQRAANIVGDIFFIVCDVRVASLAGGLFGLIAGPEGAIVGAIVGSLLFDKVWHDWIKIKGKSLDEHFKDFLAWLFGGCK